ncbi:MAG: hypothetical protein ISEC1_P1057 [Thiomicrorhabdus sp.]|nr:MAG: hypothetical protein ISEC1_P1057 [Thiomicrorhabdus sp.]
MKVALINTGIKLGEFKIARLMKDADIIAKIPKKPHDYPIETENLIFPIY